MPETAEQLFERAAQALRMPPVDGWETFPFEGDLRPRPLQPPLEREEPRRGVGGAGCHACTASDDEYAWSNDTWRLRPLAEPTGLPLILLLEPRAHYAEPGDLPDEVAADLGIPLARIERAVRSVGEIGRVHVCRWGDGSEHLHWWFLARPARLPQLVGSFAAIWDDVLPAVPEEIWRANVGGGLGTRRAGEYDRPMTRPAFIHFTGNDDADALLAEDPLALLIGFALDQQVPVQTAFAGPLKLKQRLGTLDPGEIAATDPGRLEALFRERPAIHRFPGSMARRVQELCAQIEAEYGGDAARVWSGAADGRDLRRRIGGLPGFGPMKITALGSVLAKRFDVAAARELVPDHPTLGDVDSPEALAEYQAKKRAHKAAMRAART